MPAENNLRESIGLAGTNKLAFGNPPVGTLFCF
jgi:hypothetical protein